MESIGLEEARRTLGEIVDRVRFTEEPVIITRQGKTAVFVVSSDWYRAAFHALYGKKAGRAAGITPATTEDNDPGNLEIRGSEQ